MTSLMLPERSELAPQAKELLERVQRQAKLFETALTHINDFTYIFDRGGRFIYANKPLLDLWGKTLDQAVGKDFFELDYPEDLARKLQRQIQQVIQTRTKLVDETPYTSPTGVAGYYEYIFSPVLGPDGEVDVVAGSTRVITERSASSLNGNSLSVRCRTNGRGSRQSSSTPPPSSARFGGRITCLRWRMIATTRSSAGGGIIGKTVREALPEVEGQGFFELLDKVYRTGETFVGDEMEALLRRNGNGSLDRRFMNFVYQALREPDGAVSGIFVHGIDVTEMVEARNRFGRARRSSG